MHLQNSQQEEHLSDSTGLRSPCERVTLSPAKVGNVERILEGHAFLGEDLTSSWSSGVSKKSPYAYAGSNHWLCKGSLLCTLPSTLFSNSDIHSIARATENLHKCSI